MRDAHTNKKEKLTWILGEFTHKNILFLWGPKSPRMTREFLSLFFLKKIYKNKKKEIFTWILGSSPRMTKKKWGGEKIQDDKRRRGQKSPRMTKKKGRVTKKKTGQGQGVMTNLFVHHKSVMMAPGWWKKMGFHKVV